MTEEAAHSPLGPSRWDRFVRCPGSVRAEAPFEDTADWEAAEGTAFHWLMAQCLDLGFEPEDFLGQEIQVDKWVFEFNEEICHFGRPGLDWIRGLVERDPGWELFVEVRVDISPWTRPGEFGTSDVVLIHRENQEILVWDWKYGRGEPVYPADSWQLRAYALGAWYTLAQESLPRNRAVTSKVTLHIEQPRYPGAGGSIETTLADLFEDGLHAAEQSKIAGRDDAVRRPGEKQCKYCRAAPTCGAFAEWNLEMLNKDFDDLDAEESGLMLGRAEDVTPERRSTILRARPLIQKWLDALHASAYRDAELGNPVPGMKLVEGRRPPRKYAGDRMDEIETVLVGELDAAAWTEPKLISPSAAEKALGRDRYFDVLADLVEQGAPKPILVGEEDRRPAIRPVTDDMDNLDETTTEGEK